MSYSTAANFTVIDDLPELDDIESHQKEKYSKFIRKPHTVPNRAGMDMPPPPPMQHQPMHHQMPPPVSHLHEGFEHEEQGAHNDLAKKYNMSSDSPSCLSVADHVENCPICSKLYKNNDRTMYIITIVVLIIICLLLFKRVLDK